MSGQGKIFIVDDDANIAGILSAFLQKEGYELRTENVKFDGIVDELKSWNPDIVLLDIRLAGKSGIEILEEIKRRGLDLQVIMLTADDTLETAVKCMKLGASDYLTKPLDIDEVKIVIAKILEKGRLQREVRYLRKFYAEAFDKELIGESTPVLELKQNMEKISRSRVPGILITGESGTGKELVARCIHRSMSKLMDGGSAPFIAVNCSSLPETLLESELFGYEKGSFTDAKTDKKGIFELADNGTILLDEIGDMKIDLQSKLLRVLEERAVRRIGGRSELPIDVVVLATTSRNIPEAVGKSEFRKDLFYRLNIFSLYVPPLRERRNDIPLLARHFLSRFTIQYRNKTLQGISPEAERLLSAYDWPGNVRELKNVIERIVVLENAQMIMPEHLPREIVSPKAVPIQQGKRFLLPEEGLSLDDLEKDLIIQALEKSKNNKTLAAKLLNISYDSLRYQIKKFGLDPLE
jgi:DNA-binding NtrC family response regulator